MADASAANVMAAKFSRHIPAQHLSIAPQWQQPSHLMAPLKLSRL